MTELLCAGLSVTAAVSCTATGLSAEPQAGATWLSEGAAVSTGINDAALFIHSATLVLRTTLLHVVWLRSRMHEWPRDRLIGKAVTASSTQIHRFIHLFIICQSHFVPQRHYLAGKAHNTWCRVGKMSPNEPEQEVLLKWKLSDVNTCTLAIELSFRVGSFVHSDKQHNEHLSSLLITCS